MALALTLLLIPATVLSAADGPSLVFSKDDLPALRQRIAGGDAAVAWEALKARADACCDPASPGYADPERLDAEPGGQVRPQVLGHTFGRRLTSWAEDLGLAYQVTGDEKYGRHGAAILMAAVQRLPVTDPRPAKSFAGARGDIVRGLAVGYDWLGELLDAKQREQFARVAADYVRNILAEAHREGTWWVPYHNFMGVAGGAAGCLALKLRDAYPDEAPGWVTDCTQIVATYLDAGFDEQGACFEGTGYGVYGLTNATLFAEALRRSGGPDLLQHPKLLRVPHFYAMSVLPGERVVEARNDANYAGLDNPLFLLLAQRRPSPLAAWLWERCGGGTEALRIVWDSDLTPEAPSTLCEHFEGRGLCVFRTGWETEDLMFSVEAGPYHKVTHNQADKGSFTLYGLGQRWAIDSGYGNNQLPGGRDQTEAHNCVLIDGEGQALSGAGLGTDGTIARYADEPGYGYCLADATDAYNRNSAGKPGAVVRHALRHALFLKPRGGVPAYAVVLDDIVKDDDPHRYTWLLHTAANTEIETEEGRAVLHPNASSGGAYVETPPEATGQGTCTWRFAAKQDGQYTLWASVRAAGPEPGKSDSFFVQVDEGRQIAWHAPGGREWRWGEVTDGVPPVGVTFALTAGEHVLRFLTREPGAQVDRLALTTAPDATPPFTGDPRAILLQAEEGEVAAPMRVVSEEGKARPPRMVVRVAAAAPVFLGVDGYEAHPRLNAETTASNPRFAAVLLPLPGDVPEPSVRYVQEEAGLRVRVMWTEATVDEVFWPAATGAPPIVTRAPREP